MKYQVVFSARGEFSCEVDTLADALLKAERAISFYRAKRFAIYELRAGAAPEDRPCVLHAVRQRGRWRVL